MIDNDSWSPLHHACRYGRTGLVKLLVNNHCKIDSVTNDGYQPIHLACENGHIDIVKILIDNKCDINASDKWGSQPIHLACFLGLIDIVKILIDNKCDINAYDKIGYQPIHWACENGDIDIVEILIDNKCDINASDNWRGYQPIHLACENGHIDIVKILIANDCVMNESSKISLIALAMDQHYKTDRDYMSHRKIVSGLANEIFKKGEFLGSGAFGKVYKNKISITNRDIAVKKSNSKSEDRKNIEGNINKYLFRIVHKNIVRYFGTLEKSQKFYICMEYMPGGSLENLIDKSKWIENSKVIKFSKEILEGLEFIHSEGIIHRDIKPENMLLDHDETLKLTDFGLSKSLRPVSIVENTNKAITFCGTPNYLAPEIFMGEEYDFPADIWSTGASIIHMITGKSPYYLLEPPAVMFRIGTTKKIEFTPCEPISETMQSFINDLLKPEQTNRPNAKDLLKHSIFDI